MSILARVIDANGTADQIEATVNNVREGRKAMIEMVNKLIDVMEALSKIPTAGAKKELDTINEVIEEVCTDWHIQLNRPDGLYWDDQSVAEMSEKDAWGEICLHRDSVAFRDGDSDDDKAERKFAEEAIDFYTTRFPDLFAR